MRKGRFGGAGGGSGNSHPTVSIAPDSADKATIGTDQVLHLNSQGISESVKPTISTLVKSILGNNHESYLIENTANESETVQSSWTVLPFAEQVGEFKAVVMVRNKALNTIITLMNILSFDYSDAVKVVQQNPMLIDANITLTVGVDAGTSKLYATVAGMTTDNKRIHLCFERCVLGERLISLPGAELDLILETVAILTAYLNLEATADIVLNFEAVMGGYCNLQAELTTMLEASAILSGIAGLQANVNMVLNAQAILGAYKKLIANNFTMSLNAQAILMSYKNLSAVSIPMSLIPLARLTSVAGIIPSVYKGHGVIDFESGFEPTVIVENGLVRVWYTNEDYINEVYRYGNASYGTMQYPFANIRIEYKDMPVSEFENCVQNGLPLNWQNHGVCCPGAFHSYVCIGPDGKYNLLGPSGDYGAMEFWQSDTGYPGTWTKISANIGVFNATYKIGNPSFFFDGSIWHVWIEFAKPNIWKVSYWTGASLTTLSRIDSDAAPAMTGYNGYATSCSHVLPTQYFGKWVLFSHDCNRSNNVTPTELAFYTSDYKNTGWTRKRMILKLSDLAVFMSDPARPFNLDSQLADSFVFEINGKTYLMYETIWQEFYDIPSLSVLWWDLSIADLIPGLLNGGTTGYLGAVNITLGLTASAILTSASANVTYYDFVNQFDASNFIKISGGNASVTENILGEKIFSGSAVGDVAGIRFKDPISKPIGSETVSFKIRVRLDDAVTATNTANIFTIFQSSTEILAAPTTQILAKRRIFPMLTTNTVPANYSPIYMVNSAGNTNVIVRANQSVQKNAYYDCFLEMTAASARVRLVRVSDSVELSNSGWKNWGTDIKDDGNSLWLLIGSVWTDSALALNYYIHSITKTIS